MNWNKIGLMTLSILMTLTVFAQSKNHGKMKKGNNGMGIIEYSEELGLSVEQKAAIWDLQNETKKSLKEKRANRDEMKKEDFQKDRAVMEARLNEILTEEQQVKWAAIKEEKEAERQEKRAEHSQMRAAAKSEIDNYVTTNVKPTMSAERKAFDVNLTAEEKSMINELRSSMAEHKETRQEHMGQKSDKKMKGKDQKMKESHKDQRDQIKSIIEVHKAELEAIWAKTADKRAVWDQEIKSIQEKYQATDGGTKDKKAQKPNRRDKGDRETMSYAQFLLMDF